MRRWGMILVAAAAASVLLYAVTVNGSLEVLGRLSANVVDFTGAQSTAPMRTGTALPPSCSVGQAFFRTDAAAGQNIYLCTAADTWTPVQGAGGGAAYDQRVNPRYISAFADFLSLGWNASTHWEGGFYFSRVQGSQNLNNPHGAHPEMPDMGMMSISTTATAGNQTRYQATLTTAGFPGGSGLYAGTSYRWELQVRFRYPAAADASASAMMLSLTSGSNTSTPPLGLGLRFLAGTDSELMFYTSGSNGVWTSTAPSGVAPDTQFHTLRIRSDGAQSYRIHLSLDGGAEIAVCPSGCALPLGSALDPSLMTFAATLRTEEAAQKIIQLDYVSFWMDRGAAR